jgi:hypothetical protein
MNANLDNLDFESLVPSESRFLKKEDCGGDWEGLDLTIRAFSREELQGNDGPETRTVMHFEEDGVKPMILNKTNSRMLPLLTGAQTAGEAVGKTICVFNDPSVTNRGRLTGGIRLRKAGSANKPSPGVEAFDDDIPF